MVKLNEIKLEINREESKVVNCQIKEEKLITQLDDGRKISIFVSLLTERSILGKNVNPRQLIKYELQNEGRYIYFPDIDEILPAWIISKGLHSSCFD